MAPQAPTHARTYHAEYAANYDLLTAHKEYEVEVDALAQLIERAGGRPGTRVLDVGCGTGTHAALLARRGYDVTGVEPAADMARQARAKAPGARVVCGDVAELDDDGFACCVSLFNVVNCLPSLEALVDFLGEISDRLIDRGLLLVEAWNPVAAIAVPPTVVARTSHSDAESIAWKVVPTPDFLRQRLKLEYRVAVEPREGQQPDARSFAATHELVLFTPLEIDFALRQAGFGDVEVLTALPELAPAGPDDRMLAFTAAKVAAPERL